MIGEEIINFGEDRSLWGIFRPGYPRRINQKICVIFLNAGLIHKIGPNRLYKNLSTVFSEIGLNTFRFDFSGIGDSVFSKTRTEGDNAYLSEVRLAMNWIQENKGIDEFLLTGICTGATVAYLTSIQDPRVVGLSLIDGVYADDHTVRQLESKAYQRTIVRYYKKNLFSLKRWIKVFSGKSRLLNVRSFVRFIGKVVMALISLKIISKRKSNKKVHSQSFQPLIGQHLEGWKLLIDRGVRIQTLFCEGGTAIEMYEMTVGKGLDNYVRTNKLQYKLLKDLDHTFTPLWSQQLLADLLISWLQKEFGKNNAVLVSDQMMAEKC